MKNVIRKSAFTLVIVLTFGLLFAPSSTHAGIILSGKNPKIASAKIINRMTVEVLYDDNQRLTIDFYGENIFRMFRDNNGGVISDPEAKPEAQILVDNPRKPVSNGLLVDKSLNSLAF